MSDKMVEKYEFPIKPSLDLTVMDKKYRRRDLYV